MCAPRDHGRGRDRHRCWEKIHGDLARAWPKSDMAELFSLRVCCRRAPAAGVSKGRVGRRGAVKKLSIPAGQSAGDRAARGGSCAPDIGGSLRMPRSCVVALDLGTSGNRAIAFDEKQRVLVSAYREFPQIFPRPGWVEHDGETIWKSARA